MNTTASSTLRVNGRSTYFTLSVSTYSALNCGYTSVWKAAQCGQVGEAYSITVTSASGLPSTLSGSATLASAATSCVVPSWACTVPRPVAKARDAAVARMMVSRRVMVTLQAPDWFGGRLHGAKVAARGRYLQVGVNGYRPLLRLPSMEWPSCRSASFTSASPTPATISSMRALCSGSGAARSCGFVAEPGVNGAADSRTEPTRK